MRQLNRRTIWTLAGAGAVVLGLGVLSACRTDEDTRDRYGSSTSASQAPNGVGEAESDRTAQVDPNRGRGEASSPDTAKGHDESTDRWNDRISTATTGMSTSGVASDRDAYSSDRRDQVGKTGDMQRSGQFGTPRVQASLVNESDLASKGTAMVQATTTGIDIVDPATRNEQAKEGEGHLHYRVDDGPIVATTAEQLSFVGLPPGEHRITVELAGNDHKPIGDPQSLTTNITGKADVGANSPNAPESEKSTAYGEKGTETWTNRATGGATPTLVATLVDPAKKSREKAAVVMVKAMGVELADAKSVNAKPLIDQKDRVKYQVDDLPSVITPLSKLSFHELTPGRHTITVQLVDRDQKLIGQAQRLDVEIPSSHVGD
jgi:uncharacterized protein DUF6130